MTITVYAEGDHPSGFIGIRVTGTLPCGNKIQEYWNFRERIAGTNKYKAISASTKQQYLREAKAFDKELKKYRPQKSASQPHHLVKPARQTSVSRLRLIIECKNRQGSRRIPVPGELFEWDYGYPAFRSMPYSGSRRRKGERSFRISKFGYRGAWEAAVRYWASGGDEASEIKMELVMEDIPHPRQFTKLYWQMVKELSAPPDHLLKTFRQWERDFKKSG